MANAALQTQLPLNEPLMAPDEVGHIAEVLARRRHRATLLALAMTCRAHFIRVLMNKQTRDALSSASEEEPDNDSGSERRKFGR